MLVVTSFHVNSWHKYSKKFLETFKEFWPSEVRLEAYYHDGDLPEDAPQADNIVYKKLEDQNMLDFKERNADKNGGKPYNYRVDAVKFCHKVFAITGCAEENEDFDGWMMWLDADTLTKKELPLEVLKSWLDVDASLVFLSRTAIDYCESSFMGFNMQGNQARILLDDLLMQYLTDEVFSYREWHDGFIIERLIRMHVMHGLKVHSLSEDCEGLEAFKSSCLAEYMDHFKGPAKEKMHPPVRYNQIIEMISFYMPKTLLETGTWNGDRAIQMCAAALQSHDEPVHYYGFDLFESGDKVLDQEEFNAKPNVSIEKVEAKLQRLADMYPRFTFNVYEGNTRETLPQLKVDFAYLDGGHSIETARNDFDKTCKSDVIVMDDYFVEHEGRIPPEEWQGTNKVIDSYEGRKFVLPSPDLVNVGGITKLAVVVNEGEDPPLMNKSAVPIVVNPVDCVEKQFIFDNIDANLDLIDTWIDEKFLKNNEKLTIASAGGSLDSSFDSIKDRGEKVLCVKHALPRIAKAGIIPWGCVVLDPRPIDGVSTHGVKRQDLFDKLHKDTIFFVASMTDPSVTKFLLKSGVKVIGWHAYSQAQSKVERLKNKMMIVGGTCAAMRTIPLAHTLGFRDFTLYGFDSCIYDITDEMKEELDEQGRQKYVEVGVGGRKFWTTGELLAQAQDFERMIDSRDFDVSLDVQGEGIIPTLWQNNLIRDGFRAYGELLNE
jgi:hypothetical protein